MTVERRIAVRIVHHDPLLAAGLHAVLAADPEIDIVDAPDANGHVCHLHDAGANVDVLVADYEHGLRQAAKPRASAVRDGVAEARVMVFTSRDSESEIRHALQAAVHGYLVQGCSADETVCGVKSIARGVKYFCPTVAQRMANSIAHEVLTGRESDVLSLLFDGLSNKSIARELDVAVGTVKTHLRAILAKLGANSRSHAVSLAAERGLLWTDVREFPYRMMSRAHLPPR